MQSLTVQTSGQEEIVDITEVIQDALAGKGDGMVCVNVGHCTCALYLNENESGLVADTLDLVREVTGARTWRHDRIDDNAAAHLGATLLGHEVLLPCRQGRLELGTWQRLMLVELDGPRQRTIRLVVLREQE